MNETRVRKGVKTKLFGVLFIILGALDSMLSWRGGFDAGNAYLGLIAAGVALFAIGAIRQQSHSKDRDAVPARRCGDVS